MKDTRLPPCLLVIRHLLLDAVGLPRQLGQLGGQVAVRGDADSVGVDHRGPCPVRFLNWGLQISKIHFHDFFLALTTSGADRLPCPGTGSMITSLKLRARSSLELLEDGRCRAAGAS